MLLLVGLGQTRPILFAPTALMVIFLAANAQASLTVKRSLGLFSYGLSRAEMFLGQYCRGLLLAALGMLPLQLASWMRVFRAQPFVYVMAPTMILGGVAYLIPLFRQLRSRDFVGLLKN